MSIKVQKRDGRIVPLDRDRLAESLRRAAISTGQDDPKVADELAEAICFHLRSQPEPIPTARIREAVEEALVATDHTSWLTAYRAVAEERERMRTDVRVGSFAEASLDEESQVRWSKNRLVRNLILEAGIGVGPAREIGRRVEDRIRRAGLEVVPRSLLRTLISQELRKRLPGARLQAGPTVSTHKREIRALTSDPHADPVLLDRELARLLLRSFAAEEVYQREVTWAHEEGVIRIRAPEEPYRPLGAVLHFERLLEQGRRGPIYTLLPLCSRAVRKIASHVSGPLLCPALNWAWAPFLGDWSEKRLEPFLRSVFDTLSVEEQPLAITLPESPPRSLGDRPLHLRGHRRGRTTYGQLATEAHRLATFMREVRPDSVAILEQPVRASGWEVLMAPPSVPAHDRPVAIHLVGTVAVNVAAAAFRAGRGEVEEFRSELAEATDRALEALLAKRAVLDLRLDPPLLPLWGKEKTDGDPWFALEGGVGTLTAVGWPTASLHLLGEDLENPNVRSLLEEWKQEWKRTAGKKARAVNLPLGFSHPTRKEREALAKKDREQFPDLAEDLPDMYD